MSTIDSGARAKTMPRHLARDAPQRHRRKIVYGIIADEVTALGAGKSRRLMPDGNPQRGIKSGFAGVMAASNFRSEL